MNNVVAKLRSHLIYVYLYQNTHIYHY